MKSTIKSILLAAALFPVSYLQAATVIHAGVEVVGIQHNLMTGHSLDIGHEAHATGVFLISWVVQSGLFRKAEFQGILLLVHKSEVS